MISLISYKGHFERANKNYGIIILLVMPACIVFHVVLIKLIVLNALMSIYPLR